MKSRVASSKAMLLLSKGNEYVISMISKISLILITFICTVIINRYLGPSLKGEYALIINYVGILTLILNLGIGQSYTYFHKNYGGEIKQKYINIIYLQFLTYISLFLILLLLINGNGILWIIALLSILTQFERQVGFIAMVSNINKRNLNVVFTSTLYLLILTIIYILAPVDKLYVILALFVKSIIQCIYVVFQNGIYPLKITFDRQLTANVISFSFFPMITSLLITFNYSLDIILLKFFEDYSRIGIYSLGVTLAGMLWIIPDAFKDVLFNKTAKNDSISDIIFSIKFNVILSLIITLGFTLAGKRFIIFFFGKEFIDAYEVSLILFIGAIPMIFFKMINTLYISKGKQKLAMIILLISVAGNIVFNLLLIPIMGILGAAVSSVVSYCVCGVIFLFTFLKDYNLKLKGIFFLDDDEKAKIRLIIRRILKK